MQTRKDPEMVAHLEELKVRVVLKPFNIDDLLATLADAVEKRHAAIASKAAR